MKRFISALALICLIATSASAQKSEKSYYTPKKGDWAVGVIFNPASLGSKLAIQPKHGEFAGTYVQGLALDKRQMFIMSQDPVAGIRFKYHTSNKSALRISAGLNGSVVNYREYVTDDRAVALNPNSTNKVVDNAQSAFNSVSLMVGNEWKLGEKAVKFVFGFDVMYTVAGGKLRYQYGNAITEYNKVPSTMPMLDTTTNEGVNDWVENAAIPYARPVRSYNQGYIHGIGISVDMGLECFVAERLSLGVALNFTPLMFTIQPRTWTTYEGFNNWSGKVEEFTNLVSPGSNALLYGTENIGCRISMQYYFGK
jgi:hypothetical protein